MSLDSVRRWVTSVDWRSEISVLTNPTDDPKRAVLIYAILAVLVLIILTFTYLIVSEPKRTSTGGTSGTAAAGKGTGRRRRDMHAKSLVLSVVLLGLLGVAAMDVATHIPAYCTSCHQMRAAHTSWRTSTHGRVGCIECHARPGLAGEVEGVIWGAGMVVTYAKDPSAPRSGSVAVPNDGCRRCHRAINKTVVGTRTRVPHKYVSATRYLCTSCHLQQGHAKGPRVAATAMNSCLTSCHCEGQKSTACTTCHPPGGFAMKASGGASAYPRAGISRRNCDGCHPVDRCNACHGIYMPHPADFNSGKRHALLGFTRKGMCFDQCHTPEDCLQCHKQVGTHGGSPWITKHGEIALPYTCDLCHHQNYAMHTKDAVPSQYFCDNCHENVSGPWARLTKPPPADPLRH